MPAELSPIQRSAHAFRHLIDGKDKAESTKLKYKKALDNAPAAAVDPAGRSSIRAYAAALSHATISTTQRYLNLELNLDLTISDFVPLA